MLSAALTLAARGFPVFPLHEAPGGACTCHKGAACERPAKHPRVKDWPHLATSEPSQVRAWWARWPTANVGIACGGPLRLVVVDVDAPDGAPNLETRAAEYGALPRTLSVRTGRGEHLYFRCPNDLDLGAVRPCAGKIAPHVDQRGPDGYVVAPPSVHALGAVYSFEDAAAPIADLPSWVYELATREKERPAPPAPRSTEREASARPSTPGRPDAFARAVLDLETAKPAVGGVGKGADRRLCYAVGVCYEYALSESDALFALRSGWNQRCTDGRTGAAWPWSKEEIERAINNVYADPRVYVRGRRLRADRPLPPRERERPAEVAGTLVAEVSGVDTGPTLRDDIFAAMAADLLALGRLDGGADVNDVEVEDACLYLAGRRLLEAARAEGWAALPPPGESANSWARALVDRFGEDTAKASGLLRRMRAGWSFTHGEHRLLIPWRSPDGELYTIQRRRLDASGPGVFPRDRAPRWPFGCERVNAGAPLVRVIAMFEGVRITFFE